MVISTKREGTHQLTHTNKSLYDDERRIRGRMWTSKVRRMRRSGSGSIGVAMIWAAVIIVSAIILKGTEYFSQMFVILAGGAAGSLIVLGGSTTRKET